MRATSRMSGTTILHYEFLEKIGSGGMGEVFKAHDKRLNRFVAIKALPKAKSGDPERRRRFIQEAQAASSLSHPNIVTIHDIFQEGDTHFIVMEYVAGRTLLELIPPNGMRIGDVLSYAAQMADALSTAHHAGIIHRDFKPANVMVSNSGLVKILDFGLAKLLQRQSAWMSNAAAVSGSSATIIIGEQMTRTSGPHTAEGSILGTVNYMSPEQAEGKPVDGRSDIFSLGAVAYEMLTGRRAFQGNSDVATLSAVLRDQVTPISMLVPNVPRDLEELVNGCLRKDPNARWQTMKEVELALIGLKRRWDAGAFSTPKPAARAVVETPKPAPSASKAGRRRGKLWLAGIACALLLLSGLTAWWIWARPRPHPAVSVTQAPPVNVASQPVADTPAAAPEAAAPEAAAPAAIIPAVPPPPAPPGSVASLKGTPVPPNVSDERAPAMPAITGQPASTSSVAPQPKGSQASQPPAQLVTISLGDGTPFPIALAEDIPNDAHEGLELTFRAAADVKAGEVVVIAKGAAVKGQIASGNGKKFLGMGGKMTFKLTSAESVDGQNISVRAVVARRTDGPAARAVETGRYAKPKELAAARGTDYVAYIDGDQTITLSK